MSLLNTKPRWFPGAVATNQGWVNPITKEVLVAIGNLKQRLTEEDVEQVVAVRDSPIVESVEPIVVEPVKATEPVVIKQEEIIMNTQEQATDEVRVRKQYAPRKPKVISEVVEYPTTSPVINEVVEYPTDSIISE